MDRGNVIDVCPWQEDVFAVDDLGIQNAMVQLYKLDNSDKKKLKEEMLRLSEMEPIPHFCLFTFMALER